MARFLLVLRWILQGSGDFTWRMSYCEELVGVLTVDDVSDIDFRSIN